MTVATALTVLRGLLLIPTVMAVLGGRWGVALAVCAVAFGTDVLDGWLARRSRQVTLLGQLLDPVVDKAFYLGLFSALTVVGRIPYLGLILFALPQLGLAVGTLVLWRRRGEFAAEGPGKAVGVLTALAAGLLLLTPHGIWAFWVAIGGQFIAGAYYFVRRTCSPQGHGGRR
jgi:cardiolipin synthase